MHTKGIVVWTVVLLCCFVLAGQALAADGHDLSWHAIAGGGHSESATFALDGGVVQPAGVTSAGDYALQSGFFYGLLAAVPPGLSADVDRDCDVDIVDIMLVASRWGSQPGDPRYDPLYDRDSDGDIDIVDIMLVASHWGESCTPELAPRGLPERVKAESPAREPSGPALSIEPESSTVQPGDLFTVEVVAEDVADLGGFEFDLTFNAQVLSVEGVELGPFLASTGRSAQALGPAIDNGAGSLRFGGFSFGAARGAVGGGTVALIHLRAVAAGSSSLIFSAGRFADTRGRAAAPLAAGEASVVVSGSAAAPPVPAVTPQTIPAVVPLPTREGR